MIRSGITFVAVCHLASIASSSGIALAEEPSPYAARAREVTEHIRRTFYDPKSGVYLKSLTIQKPDYVWLQSVMFANLVAAAQTIRRRIAQCWRNTSRRSTATGMRKSKSPATRRPRLAATGTTSITTTTPGS